MVQILEWKEQIAYLQQFHWANFETSLSFTDEEITNNKLKVYIKNHSGNSTEEAIYGHYDDALIFDMGTEDFRLETMEIENFTGKVIFGSRKDPFKNIEYTGIKK